MTSPDTCCTPVPYFKVNAGQLDAFEALTERFVAQTKNAPAAEADKLRAPLAALNPQWFIVGPGFRR